MGALMQEKQANYFNDLLKICNFICCTALTERQLPQKLGMMLCSAEDSGYEQQARQIQKDAPGKIRLEIESFLRLRMHRTSEQE
jgi:hypothetical protein